MAGNKFSYEFEDSVLYVKLCRGNHVPEYRNCCRVTDKAKLRMILKDLKSKGVRFENEMADWFGDIDEVWGKR